MAHPIRPESYIKMDNFYTLTVYEKGARPCCAVLWGDGRPCCAVLWGDGRPCCAVLWGDGLGAGWKAFTL